MDKIHCIELRLTGDELKANNVTYTESELSKSFKQARGHANYDGITVHFINFRLQGHAVESYGWCHIRILEARPWPQAGYRFHFRI